MWESSVPINNDSSNPMSVTTENSNTKLINSYAESSSDKSYDQDFQTCMSVINRFHSHPSDDEDQGGITPKASKRKGLNSVALQLNVQNIHLAANAPSVNIKIEIELRSFFLFY